MDMNTLAQQAVKVINGYRSNKIIMEFVTSEAREKIAAEIRKETGSGTTALAVELLSYRHKDMMVRVEEYTNLGLMGCYFAEIKQNNLANNHAA